MSTNAVPTDAVPVVQPAQAARKGLRIWPVLPFLAFMIAAQIALLFLSEPIRTLLESRGWQKAQMPFMETVLFGPMLCIIAIGLWWLFASRAKWRDRFLGIIAGLAIATGAWFLSEPTIRSMGFMFSVLPTVAIAATTALVILSRSTSRVSTVAALVVAAMTFGYWALIRDDGMSGDFKPAYHWRWQPTAEDKYLGSLAANNPVSNSRNTERLGKVYWPQFRGPHRDGIAPGVVLDVDWSSRAPKEIWRRKVGPGWSSFSIAGSRLFTQEQRGPKEVVVCFDAKTGAERWVHESPARFAETMGGVGPRATPTISDGSLYALGATGLLVRLDPLTGALKWERDLKVDARPEPLYWGFASSPLVVGDKVIVYAGGKKDKGIVAYDCKTGEPRWSAAAGNHTYSSPELVKLAGKDVILLLDNDGLTAVDAATGKPAWTYEWKFENYRAVQPLLVDHSGVLLGTGMGMGTRRIEVAAAKGEMRFEDRWTSLDIKPDFNDYVAYQGYLYGLDHNILCCVDLATGKRKWKNGRYGNGQLLLLPDAGQLLVLSETGDLVLIHATPEKLDEVARQKMLTGKTWNHPAMADNRIFVRNAEEAAAFELPLAGQSSGQPVKSPGNQL